MILHTFGLLLGMLVCSGAIKPGSPTFRGKEFLFFDNFSSFDQAKATCESENASLATIADNSTQSFLQTEITFLADNSSTATLYYWVGAEKDNNTDEWRWLNGATVPCSNVTNGIDTCVEDGFSNWAFGRPSPRATNAALTLYVPSINSTSSSGPDNSTWGLGDWVDSDKNDTFRFICYRYICTTKSCPGNRTCFPNDTSYECVCPEGTLEPNCTLPAACDSEPCENGGNCSNNGIKFICTCPDDFTGTICEIELPCYAKPCLNRGNCTNAGHTNYTCACVDGFSGWNCSVNEGGGGSGGLETWKIIVIAVCSGVGLILIVAVAIVCLCRRNRNQEQREAGKTLEMRKRPKNQYTQNPRSLSEPAAQESGGNVDDFDTDHDDYETHIPQPHEQLTINPDSLLEKCCSMQENNNAQFDAQFKNLRAVVASSKGERHYVNASFHDGELVRATKISLHSSQDPSSAPKFGVNQFLSMQSPQARHASKFWEIVYKESCPVVVSLSNESNQHLPPSDSACMYGKMRVQRTGEEHRKHYVKTTYEVEKSGRGYATNCTHVTEFRWTEPGDVTHALTHPGFHSFMSDLRSTTVKIKPPCSIMVCSNEGTPEQSCFLAYFALLQTLKFSQVMEIFNTVMEFRLQCDVFMETLDDYVLLHKLLAEHKVLEHSDQVDKQFGFRLKVLERLSEGRTGFDNELAKLRKLQSLNIVSNYQLQDESKYIQFQVEGQSNISYIRGAVIQNCGSFPNALAIRSPTWDGLSDFWQCVFLYRVTNLVMLTQLVENDQVQSIQYWPDLGKLAFHRGLKVKLESETQLSEYLTRRVVSVSSGRAKVNMVHWQYSAWPLNKSPIESRDLMELIYQLEQNAHSNEETLLIHSGFNMNRAGTFVCLLSLLHRKRTESMIDVMRTVHETRKQIPATAESTEQYSFLYHMMAN